MTLDTWKDDDDNHYLYDSLITVESISNRVLGFTGTREGMTAKQKAEFRNFVAEQQPDIFHHGDCLGADAEAHRIAQELEVPLIVVHPPKNPEMRAYCQQDLFSSSKVIIEPEKDYLARDRDIVDASDMLVATPKGQRTQSGTWYTIDYALQNFVTVKIIDPDYTASAWPE